MNTDYNKIVKQHFLNPKNFGVIKNPDSIGEVKNPVCNDIMKVYLKIKDNKIKDIKFQTMGCGAAIASSDIACTLVKGKTLQQAMKIDKKKILQKLKGLPRIKEHCSLLGEKAIKSAISNYLDKNKL